MAEEKTLSVVSGEETYTLSDEHGKVYGTIHFNPADPGFLGRLEELISWVETAHEEVVGEDEEVDYIQALMSLNRIISEKFDVLFGYPAAEIIFKGCGPTAITPGGEFFFEQVLLKLIDVVGDVMGGRFANKRERLEKYLDKYKK